MTLTPEQWKALDEAEREYRDLRRKWPTGSRTDDVMDARERLTALWLAHGRTLIDAARPKCERCLGKSASDVRRWEGWECPDCNGTGWAP